MLWNNMRDNVNDINDELQDITDEMQAMVNNNKIIIAQLQQKIDSLDQLEKDDKVTAIQDLIQVELETLKYTNDGIYALNLINSEEALMAGIDIEPIIDMVEPMFDFVRNLNTSKLNTRMIPHSRLRFLTDRNQFDQFEFLEDGGAVITDENAEMDINTNTKSSSVSSQLTLNENAVIELRNADVIGENIRESEIEGAINDVIVTKQSSENPNRQLDAEDKRIQSNTKYEFNKQTLDTSKTEKNGRKLEHVNEARLKRGQPPVNAKLIEYRKNKIDISENLLTSRRNKASKKLAKVSEASSDEERKKIISEYRSERKKAHLEIIKIRIQNKKIAREELLILGESVLTTEPKDVLTFAKVNKELALEKKSDFTKREALIEQTIVDLTSKEPIKVLSELNKVSTASAELTPEMVYEDQIIESELEQL
jgi:hypothetical protein